ncbi:MAG TPA: peptidyl-prolyl cis-trans isomerase [Humisphaera sp.]|jgi:hypothetical protein|nr:peptidyl-prolyl cis-trans isomerase [Humisphaera sp.]
MRRRWIGPVAGAGLAGALLSLSGCGAKLDPTLPPEAFVNRRPAIGLDSNEPISRSGGLVYDSQREPVKRTEPPLQISSITADAQSPAASQPAEPTTGPAEASTQPSTFPTNLAVGQYQSVGGVIEVVNGRPIYTDKVVSGIQRALEKEAKNKSFAEFRAVATKDLLERIAYLEGDELEFAAADKALDKQDHSLAEAIVVQWRKNEIILAGGSEAELRKRYLEQGVSLEEAASDKYRLILVQIYYQRKIWPLIDVSAQDIRRFYDANIRSFSHPAAAQFRVIKIDIAKSGSLTDAKKKAQMILERHKNGESFAELAGKFNDDPLLMRNKGAIGQNGWMERGAYVVEKVEAAVWKLSPGQVTPEPITDGRALYLAELDAIQPGSVQSFDDREVQNAIEAKLKQVQFEQLHLQHKMKLLEHAARVPNEGMDQVTLDIILQHYPEWSGRR